MKIAKKIVLKEITLQSRGKESTHTSVTVCPAYKPHNYEWPLNPLDPVASQQLHKTTIRALNIPEQVL